MVGVEDIGDLQDVLGDADAVEGEVVTGSDLGEEVFHVGGEGQNPLGGLAKHWEGADARGGVLVFVCCGDESYQCVVDVQGSGECLWERRGWRGWGSLEEEWEWGWGLLLSEVMRVVRRADVSYHVLIVSSVGGSRDKVKL